MIHRKGHKAQTAVELAVFGSILIFTLGTIIRASINRSNIQHNILKATRLALTMSYKTSAGMNVASRNFASVLIVEDRLTAASDKYGAIDRTPILMQGSGSHTANLFMPVDFPHAEDLPVFDVFVNGRHFPFSVAAFKKVHFEPDTGPGSTCGSNCLTTTWTAGRGRPADGINTCAPCLERESDCIQQAEVGFCAGIDTLCTSAGGNICSDCSRTSSETYAISSTVNSCAKLYTIIDNHPLIPEWCDGTIRPCPPDCYAISPPGPAGCNLSADERFDLDRDDLDGIAGDVSVTTGRRRFSWQWFLVMGFDERKRNASSLRMIRVGRERRRSSLDNTLLLAEGINTEASKNVLVDVDNDLQTEQILKVHNTNGVISSVDVRDSEDGDVNFALGENPGERAPGFTRDVKIYTFVRSSGPELGTYLQIDEGKLFTANSDNRQFIRTASKKDSIDVVERVFQLSRNTGRFCPTNGSVTPPATIGNIPGGDPNPVEVCGLTAAACFSSNNISRTCMDISTPTPVLFIRSRILDVHGRKWVTDTGDDPYMDFLR